MSDLVLPLRSLYYHQIRLGVKHEEFRLRTPYWEKRLNGKKFDSVIITLGYPKKDDKSRRIVRPWVRVRETEILHPHFGADPVSVFAIWVSVLSDSPPPAIDDFNKP